MTAAASLSGGAATVASQRQPAHADDRRGVEHGAGGGRQAGGAGQHGVAHRGRQPPAANTSVTKKGLPPVCDEATGSMLLPAASSADGRLAKGPQGEAGNG